MKGGIARVWSGDKTSGDRQLESVVRNVTKEEG